jgi:archaeal type IV pilus assembly protein PilA
MRQNGIRWRHSRTSRVSFRSRRRAVSPIIATILLVAITVVLAAVLYVLISGLTHGPGTRPIGSALALGSPAAGTCWAAGVTNHVCGTAGDRVFNLTIQESAGVTLGDVLLEVKTSAGSVFKNTLTAGFAVMPIKGIVPVAYYTFVAGAGLAMSSTFTAGAGYSSSSPVSTTMYIVVGTGTPASSWTPNQGNYVVAYGTGHFSGTTAGTVLP